MLSLKKLAELAEIEEKTIFPYELLTTNLKEIETINEKMFNSGDEYRTFLKTYGERVNIYKILRDYCINDAVITKYSIIKY
jgi:tetrahydromethanopterin S-methyltransferase subunit B